jgi:hypothetical protein
LSVDLSAKIPATSSKAREALAQYIPRPTAGRTPARGARPPVSLKKMLVEDHSGNVLCRSEYNPFFGTDSKLFPATGFLVYLLQHLPDDGPS